MTDTYDKKNHWYGHNGGPCPAHGETVIRVLHEDGADHTDKVKNLQWGWGVDDQPRTVAAWMITRLYREPRKAREWWINVYEQPGMMTGLYNTEVEANGGAARKLHACVLVREVLEGE